MSPLLLILFLSSVFTKEQKTLRKFPKGFQFGISTAAFQIEGAWNTSGKGENIWDHLSHTTNTIQDGSNADIACDSYHLYKRDVEMLEELGVDFYRFSISWSRILPDGTTSKINEDGINYYNNLIDEIISKNITPIITLYHFDLPQALQKYGGWSSETMVDYFVDFARLAFETFGDRVKTWITFNEPAVTCSTMQINVGLIPGNLSGITEYLCSTAILKSHAKVYHLYNDTFKSAQQGKIGIVLNSFWYEPASLSEKDVNAAENMMQFETGWFAHAIYSETGDYPKVMRERIARRSKQQGYIKSRLPEFTKEEIAYIKGTSDFFGLNHYTSKLVKALEYDEKSMPASFDNDVNVHLFADEKWLASASIWLKVVPWGFTNVLRWIRKEYNNPNVFIAENGYSDDGELEDNGRVNYYHTYINALLDAMDEGSNVFAYSAWSLMDNFEWNAGYLTRFGLYQVDFDSPNRTRTPKNSVFFYKDVIKNRAIEKL